MLSSSARVATRSCGIVRAASTLSREEKELVQVYRRQAKLAAQMAADEANPFVGRDIKVAKHPRSHKTTVVMTNGATTTCHIPYWPRKFMRLEDDYVSLYKTSLIRPLQQRGKREQPKQYKKKNYHAK
eukprot:TRINITY_DN5870_c0_g1_i2.p2 TRINITY_DN5870_c0_g1~~TRINITY_DN5870_c0_g1_i2.p2  ORF type:complete len:128 (+),score=25.27 TRINITY_DN5870_c0_g1_i2:93-476(+)